MGLARHLQGIAEGGAQQACLRVTLPPPPPPPDRSLENMAGRPRFDSLSSVEEDDYDTLADIDSDKNVIRTKVPWGPSWGASPPPQALPEGPSREAVPFVGL